MREIKFLIFLLFVGAASGIFISCTFQMQSFTLVGSHYTCNVVAMDLTDNSTHITRYNGTHMSGKSNVNVTAFRIDSCAPFNLTNYPRGLSRLFPKIKVLFFYVCAFETLTGDEVEDFPDLQYFYSHSGKLESISSNLFASTPNLVYVVFNSNSITRIPGNFFATTKSLINVHFYGNKIQHVGATFDHLANLTTLDFRQNACINMYASNRSDIPALLEALEFNCPDIETTTSITTTPLLTTTLPSTTSLITTTQPQLTTSTSLYTTTWWTSPSNTPTTWFPPLLPDKCFEDFIENFICDLSEKHHDLDRRVGAIDCRVKNLEGFSEQIESFKKENEEIKEKFMRSEREKKELKKEVEKLKEEISGKLEEEVKKMRSEIERIRSNFGGKVEG